MDEIKQMLAGIQEAVELNNAKLESIEKSINELRQEMQEGLQQVNAGQEVLAKRLFQNERDVERLKRIK